MNDGYPVGSTAIAVIYHTLPDGRLAEDRRLTVRILAPACRHSVRLLEFIEDNESFVELEGNYSVYGHTVEDLTGTIPGGAFTIRLSDLRPCSPS